MAFVHDMAFSGRPAGAALSRGSLLREESGHPVASAHSCTCVAPGTAPFPRGNSSPSHQSSPVRARLAPPVPGLGKIQRGLTQAEKVAHEGQGLAGPGERGHRLCPGKERKGPQGRTPWKLRATPTRKSRERCKRRKHTSGVGS